MKGTFLVFKFYSVIITLKLLIIFYGFPIYILYIIFLFLKILRALSTQINTSDSISLSTHEIF